METVYGYGTLDDVAPEDGGMKSTFSILCHQQVYQLDDGVTLALRLELTQRMCAVDQGLENSRYSLIFPCTTLFKGHKRSCAAAEDLSVIGNSRENEIAQQTPWYESIMMIIARN